MFKKTERLSSKEFSAYFKSGKRQHSPEFTMITSPLPAGRKIAVVVGKKVSKTAVGRNRLRRFVYAQLRQEFGEKDYKGALLLIMKPAFLKLTKKEAVAAVRRVVVQLQKST